MEQLKPFLDDDALIGPEQTPAEESQERQQGEIIGHKINAMGQDEFLVLLKNQAPSEASWVKAQTLLQEGMELPSHEQCLERGWSTAMYAPEE